MRSREKLTQFLDEYLNEPLADVGSDSARERFRLWSADADHAYVYLTVTDIGDVTSTTNNIGDWADCELAFLVPVKRERQNVANGTWELCGVGLVPVFTFVDNTVAAAARSEVLGISTTRATFVRPQNVWFEAGGATSGTRQNLLEMSAEVLPVVGEGQRSEMRKLVELDLGVMGEDVDEAEWRVTADAWSALLRKELHRKKNVEADAGTNQCLQDMLALALEPLANGQPFALYTMKQFRDVADPARACYQSIVRVARSLKNVYDLREIEEPLIVRLHEFPTQPMVERLGLVGQNVSATDTAIAWDLQPVRPFMLRVTMEEGLGERILHHSAEGRWESADTSDDEPMESYLDRQENIKVGPLLVATLDEGDPRRMSEVAYEFSLRRDAQRKLLTLAAAKTAIETIDPQIVVETILSREWGNWDEDARWRRERRDLVERHANALAGSLTPAVARGRAGVLHRCAEPDRVPVPVVVVRHHQDVAELCGGHDRQPPEPDRADGDDGCVLEPAPRVRRLADGRSATVPDAAVGGGHRQEDPRGDTRLPRRGDRGREPEAGRGRPGSGGTSRASNRSQRLRVSPDRDERADQEPREDDCRCSRRGGERGGGPDAGLACRAVHPRAGELWPGSEAVCSARRSSRSCPGHARSQTSWCGAMRPGRRATVSSRSTSHGTPTGMPGRP